MSDKQAEVRIVRQLGEMQLMKLDEHADQDWSDASPKLLLRRLREEVRELERALREIPVNRAKVLSECADVANFAAMIADVAGD
jgi:NTP pyrophosphatase (non-canonical NTP hydrolase)